MNDSFFGFISQSLGANSFKLIPRGQREKVELFQCPKKSMISLSASHSFASRANSNHFMVITMLDGQAFKTRKIGMRRFPNLPELKFQHDMFSGSPKSIIHEERKKVTFFSSRHAQMLLECEIKFKTTPQKASPNKSSEHF